MPRQVVLGCKKPAKLEPGSRVSPWFLLYVFDCG